MKIKDVSGQRFGRLVAIRFAGVNSKGGATWECLCDCGNYKIADAANIVKGSTKSCGCLANEQKRGAAQSMQHNLSRSSKPKEYGAWSGMIRRCYNAGHPSYPRYGGRGITVCDEWHISFSAFYADMGDAPPETTLDRIDNNAEYSPKNCRWATKKEQANNRRNNKIIEFNGKSMNVSQWATYLGWPKSTIANRLHLGWGIERALSEEPKKRHNQIP